MTRSPLRDAHREGKLFTRRLLAAAGVVALCTLTLIGRLIYLQILNHEHFATLSQENRVTLMPLPPTRGVIFDRNGRVLADNAPAFSLEITRDQVPDLEKTLQDLGQIIELRDIDLKRFRREIKQKPSFQAVPLRFNLSEVERARLAVNRFHFPGTEVVARLVRHYPLGPVGVHALGYVGRINAEEEKRLNAQEYAGTTHIGKLGVEQAYEAVLHGKAGLQQVETTAKGRALRVLGRTPPVAGENLYLTLDLRLQAAAEGALGGQRGSVVAIDPKTGEVLAFASTPGYDPNLFVNGIDTHDYNALQKDPDKPLINRALAGRYPPGSTVKPFLGLGGLETNKIDELRSVSCRGSYSLPGSSHRYRDWKKEGHGNVALVSAIEQSCDVYFYNLATHMGIQMLSDYMTKFGFGQKTEIDIPGEATGIMPNPAWKRRVFKQPWWPGETVITGIGQGYTLVTPLGLASTTATLANRGLRMKPRLALGLRAPDELSKLRPFPHRAHPRVSVVNQQNWDAVVQSMVNVVHSGRGTAYRSGLGARYKIAGKTGTAQVFTVKQTEKYIESQVDERLRDHAWFMAFAPAEDPRLAVAVFVENGGHGSSAAAPIARTLFDYYFLELNPLKTEPPPVAEVNTPRAAQRNSPAIEPEE